MPAVLVAAPVFAKPDGGKGPGTAPGFSNGSGHSVLAPAPTLRRGHGPNYGVNACPPGLAKKNNGCLPPGIAKQSFNVGDRWNGNYRPWTFDQVPLDWRNQYNLDPRNRYYYRNGYLYSVDPQTRLVESVIQALIH